MYISILYPALSSRFLPEGGRSRWQRQGEEWDISSCEAVSSALYPDGPSSEVCCSKESAMKTAESESWCTRHCPLHQFPKRIHCFIAGAILAARRFNSCRTSESETSQWAFPSAPLKHSTVQNLQLAPVAEREKKIPKGGKNGASAIFARFGV